jgi:TRAP transporter TAXI family solute receptor
MKIRIGTNEPEGTFNIQGKALAALLRDAGLGEVEIVETVSASVENAKRLGAGDLQFGFMAATWIGRALRGEPPFAAPIAIRMASPANAGPMFFVVRRDSGLAAIDDLRGARVAVGPEGGGMVQHMHSILDALGMGFGAIRPVYVNFAAGAAALAAGEVDVQWQCPVPNQVMTQLAERTNVRVLHYAPGRLDTVLKAVPFYRRAVLYRDAFRGLAGDSDQVGVLNVLVTHERVETDLVREVVAAMVAGADALAQKQPLYRGLADLYAPLRTQGTRALEPGGVPLHPGAVQAYRAAGLLA